jgi:hypothetical protein
MKVFSKKIALVSFLLFLVLGNAFARGVSAATTVAQSGNVAIRSSRNVNNVVRASGRYANNLARLGWRISPSGNVIRVSTLHADDLVRLGVRHSNNIARLGLREGDDIIRNFSRIQRNSRNFNLISSNMDDIAIRGISRSEFTSRFGKTLSDDLFAYSRGQYRYINEALLGNPIVPRAGHGQVGGQVLKGNDYIVAITQRANRIDNFLNTQTINQRTRLLRGENLQADELSRLFNIGNINGMNINEVSTLIRNNGHTFNNALTSTSLSTVNPHTLNSFAINGWRNADIGRANPFKIIRDIDVPVGTKGFNMSQLSSMRGQQEVLLPRGLRTRVTDVRVERIMFEGIEYDVLRVFEAIVL